MKRIAVVSGSFDPFTNGHTWLIKQALMLADVVYVTTARNATKQGMFSGAENIDMASKVLKAELPAQDFERLQFKLLKNELLVDFAMNVGASFIVRGIRNVKDFEYESELKDTNKDIEPNIDTVFVMPPPDMARISSSMVKGITGYDRWVERVSKYVHPIVLDQLKYKNMRYGE